MAFALHETLIQKAEEKLGARLPDSYRRAMMAGNGGELTGLDDDWFLYPIRDDSDRKRLARTWSDIVEETAKLAESENFPHGAVAIAHDGGGDQLVFLRAEGGFAPAVHHWFHETGDILKLAEDFAELARFVPRP